MLVNSPINGARLKPLALLLGLLIPQAFAATTNGQFEFDDSMLVGSAKEQKSIARFNQANAIEPGTYQVDIFINGDFFSRKSLVFAAGEQGHVSACLSREMLLDAGILPSAIKTKADEAANCLSLEQQVDGASSRFDFARLRLELSVPQLLMKREARGSVPLSDLSAGETVAFANYDTNYYRTRASGNTTDSTFLGLNSGLNLACGNCANSRALPGITATKAPAAANGTRYVPMYNAHCHQSGGS